MNDPQETTQKKIDLETQIEEAAIASAMNMGPAEQLIFVDVTDEEFEEIMKFMDKNKELMQDLSKKGN